MKHILSFKLFENNKPSNDGIIIDFDDLINYDIPDEIKEMMKNWDVIFKSPFSDSFYSSTDIGWSQKPDNSYRVSDHWNFKSNNKIHCLTDKPVVNRSYISIGKYDSKLGKYRILKSLMSKSKIESDLEEKEKNRLKMEYMTSPDIIEKKKELKRRISNHEIYADVIYNGEEITGLVDKYTGFEIRIIDPITHDILFSMTRIKKLRRIIVNLYDKNGEPVYDLYKKIYSN